MSPSAPGARRLAFALAGLAAATSTVPTCHAPWGNEQALESSCYTSVYLNGDVSVRRYTPTGSGYGQTFLETTVPGGGDPTAYEANILRGVFDLLLYFEVRAELGLLRARTARSLCGCRRSAVRKQ